jgi:hypothetical protein
LTVWNHLTTTPGWVTKSWEDYYSDPYGYNDDPYGFGSGPYSGYWNNFFNQVNSRKDVAGTNESTFQLYRYANQSESGVFITPNYDGLISYAAGEDYHFIGSFTGTSYSVSNYSISNEESEDHLSWWDYTKASLALAGAVVETAVGGLTAETGVGGVVMVDGSIRVAGNFSKLITMIETGKRSKSDLIPTSGGAVIGAIIDHGTGNVGQMQSILGTANDVGSAIFSVDSDYDLLNATDRWLNHWDRPGPYPGIIDDVESIYEHN